MATDIDKVTQHMTDLVVMRKYAASIKVSNPAAHDRIMLNYNNSLKATKKFYANKQPKK